MSTVNGLDSAHRGGLETTTTVVYKESRRGDGTSALPEQTGFDCTPTETLEGVESICMQLTIIVNGLYIRWHRQLSQALC